VRCWGRNTEGQLGDGTNTDRPAPVPVARLADVSAIALGGHFACALVRDGTVQCWGANADGALGDGSAAPSRSTPGPVPAIQGATEITAGWRHACARLTSGVLRCWGQNTFGQIGDGTTTARATPVPVNVAGTFARVAAGRMHTCGVRGDGTMLCWGRNQEGQLGDGTTIDRLEPVAVTW
jgi:alpha-tubulin suppressor-like RCC1 family protein